MKWLFLEAHDVWMFRESRPFAAGQAFVARSVFPPYPQTIAGVIRTSILEQAGVDFEAYKEGRVDPALIKAIGLPGGNDHFASLGALSLAGPYIARSVKGKVSRLLPAPNDLMQAEDSTTKSLVYSIAAPAVETVPEGVTNLPFDQWHPVSPLAGSDSEGNPFEWKPVEGWLDENDVQAYLKGSTPTTVHKKADLVHTEEKIGLGMAHDIRKAKTGLLYSAEFVRPLTKAPDDQVGLLIGINDEAVKLLTPGVFLIGGEGRSAFYREVPPPPAFPSVRPGRIKVILTTPAYFSGGWYPAEAGWETWVGPDAHLVSALVSKPISISGWDLAQKKPKPMRAFVPAGTVYYFEGAAPFTRPFTETPPGEPDYGAMGYGGFVLSAW
ncbi:MAG TPA: type III-B CRISPR module-associated protein Cmr3 [Aggregatilineales bacterium]|nr:type III-B CRISPR module-associated protein Cmr3 [Anaerolineales bacterium]HRE46689.1 type III-B CRISPR module-associated protein Cmr3 [Aggregatilineales bacterium]